jgi:hypothetical protein
MKRPSCRAQVMELLRALLNLDCAVLKQPRSGHICMLFVFDNRLFICSADVDAEQRGGAMNTSKLRDSTAIDKALAITAAIEKEAKLKLDGDNEGQSEDDNVDGEQAQADKHAPTADHAAMYLRGISASSSGEIDALVTDLQGLRDKLVDDGARVEKNIIAFTTLNQSVMQLTKLISESISQVKAD